MENKKPANKESSPDRVHFQQLRKKGYKFQVAPWLLVYFQLTENKKIRILWNLSRKVSHAVVRNRLKRWCREFVRIHLLDVGLNHGLDLNFVFKPQHKDFYKELRYEEVWSELFKLEKRLKETLRKNRE